MEKWRRRRIVYEEEEENERIVSSRPSFLPSNEVGGSALGNSRYEIDERGREAGRSPPSESLSIRDAHKATTALIHAPSASTGSPLSMGPKRNRRPSVCYVRSYRRINET